MQGKLSCRYVEQRRVVKPRLIWIQLSINTVAYGNSVCKKRSFVWSSWTVNNFLKITGLIYPLWFWILWFGISVHADFLMKGKSKCIDCLAVFSIMITWMIKVKNQYLVVSIRNKFNLHFKTDVSYRIPSASFQGNCHLCHWWWR